MSQTPRQLSFRLRLSVASATITGVRILRSALKHGCTPADIAHAVASSRQRICVGEDPVRWLYLGVDAAARPLEIVTVEGDDGGEVVIHAMKLRKKYYPKGGRA